MNTLFVTANTEGKALRCFSSGMKKSRCFTLVELLVVMAIIVIVLGVGVSGLREMRGAALTQMGASEMKMAAKSAYKSAVRNKIPSAVTLVVKADGVSQGYLMAGTGGLTSYCGFDQGASTTGANGLINETFTGTINLVPGAVSNGYSLTTATSLTSSKSFGAQGNISAVYIEAMVKNVSGTRNILSLNSLELKSSGGYLKGSIVGAAGDFPTVASEEILISGNDWKTIGILGVASTYSGTASAYLFYNGTYAGNIETPLASPSNADIFTGSLQVQGGLTTGVIDEIKGYNLGRGDVVMNDLKGGFFFGPNITSGGNYQQITLLDTEGKLIQRGSSSEDYVAFASVGVTGTITLSSQTSTGTSVISGTKSSGLPEGGYLGVYDAGRYELIEYDNFNGNSVNIKERQIGTNTGISGSNKTFYYAIPIVFNTTGGVL